MVTVEAHYANHLARIYLWMAGGMQAALTAGAADLAPWLPGTGLAVDLGAGFGMHSIPLARAGYHVVAIDSSAALLQVLRDHSEGLPLRTVESDLRDFRTAVTQPADLIVCMGDTLTHLESRDEVERLCGQITRSLKPTGTFVATFRDYSAPLTGDRRFIPVRGDSERILTCFLEESDDSEAKRVEGSGGGGAARHGADRRRRLRRTNQASSWSRAILASAGGCES